ncbi:MAG: DUF1835 domain-containing protein, partial [Bacteroidota bacterium]|nr:DUF1835 domain-containing protein [Bacteroidota bacterium]
DSQMQRLLDKLKIFYEQTEDQIRLTRDGYQALDGKKNFYRDLQNNEFYGGARIFDFLYDSESHRLLKL